MLHEHASLQAERDRLKEALSESSPGGGTSGLGAILGGPMDGHGAGLLLGEVLVGAAATLWDHLSRR
jgi:hypothetical protein